MALDFLRIAKKGPIVIEAMRTFFRIIISGIFLAAGLLLSGCKTKPVPVPEEPLPLLGSSLIFDGITADDPGLLHLSFSLGIGNPFPSSGRVLIESWQVELNGQTLTHNSYLPKENKEGFNLVLSGNDEYLLKPAVSRQGDKPIPSSASFPLLLDMNVEALSLMGHAPYDDYAVNLILDLDISFDSAPPQKVRVSGIARFPGVQAPVFSITSIAILKAELINTRFRVGLKITNPNPYPVELSAFGYELYGNGRLWADGVEKNILRVNGKSSLAGNLFLIMNFINMKRDLLDQIINLEDVNYRFAGDALVSTSVEYLPKFKTEFDLSGYSPVYDN